MQKLDIAVAGCGPAGLAAALYLKRAGHAVTLFERFAEPEPVGSGLMLQATGLAVLADLGLLPRIVGHGARIDRLRGRAAGSGRLVLDVGYQALGPSFFGVGIHRAALFGILFDAVRKARIRITRDWAAANVVEEADKAVLVSATGDRAGPFDLVVDATGARSVIRTALRPDTRVRPLAYGALWATLPWPHGAGFDASALDQRYERAAIMVGVLPTGRQPGQTEMQCSLFWSLKGEDLPRWQDAGLAPWKRDVARIWPQTQGLLDAITDPAQMTFARYAHHTLARPHAGRTVFIGDSAHATSPQLGQGANMALLDARALAVALAGAEGLTAALDRYARLRRFHVRLYQAASLFFTPVYQSDGRLVPALRDRLFAPASRFPGMGWVLASLVAGTLGGPLKPLGVAWPP